MAENKDNQQDEALNSLENELDMILDNTATSADDDSGSSFMNDDDAIDQLLMDDEFGDIDDLSDDSNDISDELNEDDDLSDVNQLFEDVTRLEENEPVDQDDELDEDLLGLDAELERELAGDDNSQSEDENEVEDKLLDEEIDALTEDEFGSVQPSDPAEFDISTDDDTVVMLPDEEDEDGEYDEPIDDAADMETEEALNDEFSETQDMNELEAEDLASEFEDDDETVIEPVEDSVSAELSEQLESLTAEIRQLKAAQEILKEELAEQVPAGSSVNDETTKTIEQIQADQKKLNKVQTLISNKKPVLSYIALALGIIALLVAVFIAYLNMSSDSVLSELSTQVSIMLEQDAYKEVGVVKQHQQNTEAKLESIDKKVEQLVNKAKLNETGAVVETLSDDVAALLARQEKINAELAQLQETLEKLKKQRVVQAKKIVKKVIEPDWSVILVSYKQDWVAKKKAAEFAKLGVATEVVPATIKGENWYRLRVKGFKSKDEAKAYAEKLKQKLNFTSPWVTKD